MSIPHHPTVRLTSRVAVQAGVVVELITEAYMAVELAPATDEAHQQVVQALSIGAN